MAASTRRRRTVGALVTGLTLIAAGLVARPALATGTGGDCGGGDTPPARHLASGETCAGSFDEPEVSTAWGGNGITTYGYEDRYTFDQTDGDVVTVTLSGSGCLTSRPTGSTIASTTGVATLEVDGKRTASTSSGAPAGSCPTPLGSYDVRVDVTPNDRPAVNPTSVPRWGNPGDTFTFAVSGTDPDGNLTSLGAQLGRQPIDWQTQGSPSGSWSTTFQYQLSTDTEITFYARDAYGAISPPSASYSIIFNQNDCGVGHDAVVEPITIPKVCEGALSGFIDTDAYTFTPAPGQRPRAIAEVAGAEDYYLTLTSPSGQVFSTSEDPLIGTTEPGQWRVSIRTGGDPGTYTLVLDEIGAPAAPTLTINAPPTTHQGDWYEFTMRATDPWQQTLRFDVDYGNGSHGIYPLYRRAASGETVTAVRRFQDNRTSDTISVTVSNQDGQTDTKSFSVSITLHNDCGLGTPPYDAPSSNPTLELPAAGCTGTIGHLLPDWGNNRDLADFFQSPVRCSLFENCKVRATLTTSPGLAATVVVDDSLRRAEATCSGACTVSADQIGPSWPAAGFPRVGVRLNGGKGSYTLRVEKMPIQGGLLGG